MATYQRLPSGKWRARIDVVTPTGKRSRVSRTADTKRELQKLVAEVELHGALPTKGGDTVADHLDRFLASPAAAQRRATTNAKARYEYDRHVVPHIGDLPLHRLTPARLDDLYAMLLLEKGLAASTVGEIHTKLSAALAQAVRWGSIPVNPCDLATPPAGRKVRVEPPSDDAVRALLAAAEGMADRFPWLPAFLRLAVATGARQGELLAARWEDFTEAQWSVRRTRSYGGGVVAINEPKTASSIRTISIDKATVVALEDWQDHTGARWGWAWPGSLNAELPMSASGLNRAWRALKDTTGVDCRFHDLRHYHATTLLSAGVDVRTVAGRLGHERPSVTLNIYAAWMPSRDSAAADVIGELLA